MAGPAPTTLSNHKDRSAGPVHSSGWLYSRRIAAVPNLGTNRHLFLRDTDFRHEREWMRRLPRVGVFDASDDRAQLHRWTISNLHRVADSDRDWQLVQRRASHNDQTTTANREQVNDVADASGQGCITDHR